LKRRLSSVGNATHWQHRSGFWKPYAKLFAGDRVHLSPDGQAKFAKSIRAKQ